MITTDTLASLVSVWSGSAPPDETVIATFEERYGVPVLGNYGATEFAGAVATWSLADHQLHHSTKAKATGRILPAIADARIRSPADGTLLPTGATGVLELKVHRIGDAWIATTDLANLDDDGFLYLHGRADDAIVRGGFKLLPETIAVALRQHAAVRDAAVIGIAHNRLGQVPVAVVELRNVSPHPSEVDLIAFVRSLLPAYFAPVAIQTVAALPRTAAMKVDQSALRAMFDDRRCLD